MTASMNLIEDLMLSWPDEWQSILVDTYKIKIVRDGDLVSLKYNALESPMHERIVQQCRGMVVNTALRRVLARPYDKFWNYGEAKADAIDWGSARVQEKLDGSLMIMYWGVGGWHVATFGHPTAGGPFGRYPERDIAVAPNLGLDEPPVAGVRTFRDAFADAWMSLNYRLPTPLLGKIGIAFLFELCDAPNRVVVKHDKPRLVLHGARNLDGTEYDHEWCAATAKEYGWEHVRSFPLATVADCLTAVEALDPLQQEGYVVVDRHFRRIKIKSSRYVLLHALKGEGMSRRRAVKLWQSGDAAELLTHFPEFASDVGAVHGELDAVAEQAVRDYAENMPRASRRDFANAVKEMQTAPVLFKLLAEETPNVDAAKAIMRKFTTPALERML